MPLRPISFIRHISFMRPVSFMRRVRVIRSPRLCGPVQKMTTTALLPPRHTTTPDSGLQFIE
ncbi:hypothetical protein [Gordonia sp. (in: high G+C Gram-positive bacteria)]|uniref:hypothetical protein n=1 Tax=Gordonia sp. (in: high G+C Gram-positive bacteria) TaxID=84139 RepID=UPI003C76283B